MVKAEDAEDFARRGMEDLRSRNPMFRMPNWFSEDDDMSDLATRMSHTPHFATLGRRGSATPWRDRRNSGGSAMSGTSEDDSCEAGHTDKSSQCSGGSMGGGIQGEPIAHEIPIKIELGGPSASLSSNLPPEEEMVQADPHVAIPLPGADMTDAANTMPAPRTPVRTAPESRRVSQQQPIRNASALDNSCREEFPRSTRCSSAPPDTAEQKRLLQHQNSFPQQPQRFVSKINITPGVPGSPPQSANSQGTPPNFSNQGTPTCLSPTSPTLPQKFNTIPKPFVSMSKPQSTPQTIPEQYEQQDMPQQQYVNDQNQYYPTPEPQQQFQQPQQQQQHYQQPQQQQQEQQPRSTSRGPSGQRPSIVRNIPIFIEGADDPVKPREPTPPKPQAPQQQQQQQKPQQPQRQHSQPQFRPQQQQQQQRPQQPIRQQSQPQFRPQQQQQYFQQQPQPQEQQQPFQQPFMNVRQSRPQQQPQQPQPQQPQQQQPQPQPQPQPQQQQHPKTVPIQTRNMPAQHSQPQHTQQQQQQPQPQPQQQQPQQSKAPSPQPKTPSPQPPQPIVDPRFAQIEKVQAEVIEFEEQVKTFSGDLKSKEYLYLDEMLTRCLLKLDNVDPQGCEQVRAARKAVIRNISAVTSFLEAKASGKATECVPQDNSTNSQMVEENGIPEAMETEIQNLEIPSNPTESCIMSPSCDPVANPILPTQTHPIVETTIPST